MKKGIWSIVVLVLMLTLVLTGCGKLVEPKEAGEVAVKTIIYGKDDKKFAEVFNMDSTEYNKQLAEDFKEEFSDGISTGLGADSSKLKKKIDEFYKAYRKAVEDKATYKVKVKNDDKESPTVEVSVRGLDLNKVKDKIMKEVQAEAENGNVDRDKLADKMMDSYITEIKKANIVEKPKKVIIKLKKEQRSRTESFWDMEDSSRVCDDLLAAFYSSGK